NTLRACVAHIACNSSVNSSLCERANVALAMTTITPKTAVARIRELYPSAPSYAPPGRPPPPPRMQTSKVPRGVTLTAPRKRERHYDPGKQAKGGLLTGAVRGPLWFSSPPPPAIKEKSSTAAAGIAMKRRFGATPCRRATKL